MPNDEGQLNAIEKTSQSDSDTSQREHSSDTQVAQQDNSSPPIPWSHDEKVRFWDALKYLDLVKAHFKDRPVVYSRFLDILSEYKRGIVDAIGVVDLISALFHGHPELVNGFHTFLPPEYNLAKALSESNAVDAREAFEYLNLVKAQLGDKPDTYDLFLQVMTEYTHGTVDASAVVDSVSTLLPLLHPELIAGLNKFIPVGYRVRDSHERSKL